MIISGGILTHKFGYVLKLFTMYFTIFYHILLQSERMAFTRRWTMHVCWSEI